MRGSSRSPGRSFSASPFRGAVNMGLGGSSVVARARESTDIALQKHIRVLSSSKEQVRRARDDMSREAAAVTVALRDGNQMNSELSSFIGSYSRQLASPDCTQAMQGSLTKLLQQMKATSAELVDLMSFGRQASEELAVGQQKLQHMEGLLDCAIDIDIQCAAGAQPVSRRATQSVVVSGSPLFPGLTLHDADAVLGDSNDLCARAGRLTSMLRKATATGRNLTTQSLSGLMQTTVTQSKMLAENYAVQLRQYNGLVFEHNKATTQLAQYDAERDQLQMRLTQVSKTLALRESAGSSLQLSRGRVDVVQEALQREQGELKARLDEIDRRSAKLRDALRRFDEDRGSVEGKMTTCKRSAEQVQRTQHLIQSLDASSPRRNQSIRH